MRVPLGQDPAGHFDYADMSWFPNPAYESPGAIILTAGWFFVLALAGFLVAARKIDPHRFGKRPVLRLLALSAVLLLGPLAGSFVVERSGGPRDSIPSFAGHLRGTQTADFDGEFSQWAMDRYGLDLNQKQSRELQTRQGRGLFVPTNQTRPVIHNGILVHGLLAADQIIIVDDAGTELPLARPNP